VILTVTLNAAIDRTMAVPNFRQGNRHRSVETSNAAGGKGVNVARALGLLGQPVIASGFAGGPTGQRFLEQLAEESVLSDFVRIAAETRTNLAVIDPTSGEQTEINERGPEVTDAEVDAFARRLSYLASGVDICVLAGSLPPGVDVDLYARLVRDLRARGVVVVLDAEGEPMRAGLRAGPSIVTPNLLEAEELIGHEFEGPADLALGLTELLDMGAEEAVITRPDGCVAAVADEGGEILYLEVTTPQLESVAAVGSGDALVAGYVAARYEGRPPADCLAYGVACGADSTQHFGAGAVDRENVERLRSRVEVRKLEVPAEVG
jgi:1-phosphofructokinase/tagatose 6-phosphate kinase